jgi:hypothetical protein
MIMRRHGLDVRQRVMCGYSGRAFHESVHLPYLIADLEIDMREDKTQGQESPTRRCASFTHRAPGRGDRRQPCRPAVEARVGIFPEG